MKKPRAGVLSAAALVLLSAATDATEAREPPTELFSEWRFQWTPAVAADPERDRFFIVGHSQDRLAVRVADNGIQPSLGPLRSLSAWPSRVFSASVEPTRGRALVAWEEQRLIGGEHAPLVAQRLSPTGRKLDGPLLLDDDGRYDGLRVLYLPWKRSWLVVWSGECDVVLQLVRRSGRLGRRACVEADGSVDTAFLRALAVDHAQRRLLIVWSRHAQYVRLSGRFVGPPFELSRAGRSPAVAHDPQRERFLIAWSERGVVRGRVLKGRQLSERFRLGRADGGARDVQVAFHADSQSYLVTWFGRSAIYARWFGPKVESLGKADRLDFIQFDQFVDGDYLACAASNCLTAWEGTRGLSDGSFIDRLAIVGAFLEPPP